MPSAWAGVPEFEDFQATPTMSSSVKAKSFVVRLASLARNSRRLYPALLGRPSFDTAALTASAPTAPVVGRIDRNMANGLVPSAFSRICGRLVCDNRVKSGRDRLPASPELTAPGTNMGSSAGD